MDFYEIGLNDLIGKLSAWRNNHAKDIKDIDKVKVQITSRDSIQIFPNQPFTYDKLDTLIYFPKKC